MTEKSPAILSATKNPAADPSGDRSTRDGAPRILVIHYRYIGDTVLVVPFFRNLRRKYPRAHIVWVLEPGDDEVVKGMPYVDETLVWNPRRRGPRPPLHGTLRAKLTFIANLRRRRFDKAYVLKRSVSSALLGFASGARERIGFDTQHRGLLLTRRVPYRRDQHELENLLDVLRADGMPEPDRQLEAWVSAKERDFAAAFLADRGISPAEKIVGLHPFCTLEPRAWHEDDFAAVAHAVQKRYGARILIFGSQQDQPAADRLAAKISPAPVNAAGRTDLRGSLALLARCSLLVCNDSGIMHLAASLGLPIVALFGPGSPLRFGPWTQTARILYARFPCSPCRQNFFTQCQPSARGKPPCLEAITVPQVLDAIEASGALVAPPT